MHRTLTCSCTSIHRRVYVASSLVTYRVSVIIKDGAVPKYIQLAAILRERIESGQILPGAQIPSETELEAESGLARGTVRKAIVHLAEQGVIVTVRGKGSYVVEPAEDE